MLLKWITCSVEQNSKTDFSNAQKQWRSIGSAPGFIAQLGGWDNASGNACILGLWKDYNSYTNFMDTIHDTITEENFQEATYTGITTTLFDKLLEMPGSAGSLPLALKNSAFIRVADCIVKSGHENIFIEKQSTIWNPGMQEAEGMLGGAVWKSSENNHRFLVSTFWDSIKAHSNYTANKLPQLRVKAEPEKNLNQLTGFGIPKETNWTV